MKIRRPGETGEFEVEIVARDGATVRARVGDREVVAQFEPSADGGAILTVGERRYRVLGARRKESILVAVGPRTFEFARSDESARRHARGLAAAEVTAPMPGKVLKVMVKDGDRVVHGQAMVVIEAMKMETTLAAESDAIVKHVRVEAGQMVDHGAVLVELSPPEASSAPESGSQET